MAKNIVLLSDGTGNSAGKLSKTNVWRLYQALDLAGPSDDPEQREQIAYYDDGVGSSSFMPLAVVGGAFGWGLKRNVIDLYTFLCWNYKEGDQIYCFGFSRGAFTIRVLTGLIQFNGLVGADEHGGSQVKLRALANAAFNNFRINCMIKRFNFMEVKRSESQHRIKPPPIAFLGLWDTVAAYGLPIDELTRALDFIFPLSHSDRNLVANVDRACHALALDDERNTFHPVLWNEKDVNKNVTNEHRKMDEYNNKAKHIDEERLSQVWFCGMHSNVGGGYPDDAMAYVSLDWMMEQAEKANLHFKADKHKEIKDTANIYGSMEDSRRGFNKTYRYQPRKLKRLIHDTDYKDNQVVIERPKIHESVFQRIRNGVDGYAPIVLPSRYAVVKADGGILDMPSPDKPALDQTPIEHKTQAGYRSCRQEKVWDLVWQRRVFYFSSIVILIGLLAALPLYCHVTKTCDAPLSFGWSFISKILFLPDFADHWLQAYQSYPKIFVILTGMLILFIYRGKKLKDQIFDEMRSVWRYFRELPEKPIAVAPKPNGIIYHLRTHWFYQRFFKFMKRYVLPLAFFAVVVGGAIYASRKIVNDEELRILILVVAGTFVFGAYKAVKNFIVYYFSTRNVSGGQQALGAADPSLLN